MKLNVREKIMLSVLGVVGVIALSYFFLIKPQLERIDSLKVQKESLQAQLSTAENEIQSGLGIRDGIDLMVLDIEEMTRVFYPELLPDRFIVLLDALITKMEMQNNSMVIGIPIIERIKFAAGTPKDRTTEIKLLVENYNKLFPKEDAMEESGKEALRISNVPELLRQLESINITLSLLGTYEQVIGFMKEIEELDRSIIFTNLVAMMNEEEETVNANIQMMFYAIPKIHEQDEEFYEWPFEDEEYGKDNPFLKEVPVE